MNDFEKINTDLATLFREGRALLDAGNSAVMNGCREEAFRKFVDLGGIPNKQEDYIYLNKYNTSHKWVIIGDSQEHPYKGTFDGNGQKIEAEVEARIEAYLDGLIEDLPLATKEDIGRTVDFASGRNRYIGHLISIPSRDFKGIKVGLDCANGSSSAIAKSVFEALQAKTYVINNQPDGTNINTNCGSTHIEVLQKYVVDNGLDIGFAYDGDADRCIAVDHKGNVVDGDKIMYVCGKYLKEQGRLKDDTVVTTVMSNLGLYKSLEREDMKYEQTAVGDKYVAENMMENGYSLGGEQSGHIIFSRYAATGDGILTSLMVMEACVEKKATLCDLAREMKVYPQLLRNVRVADKKIARENPKVVAAVEEVAKKLGSDGRILVRESGTEPLIRVMVEAGTDELCLENVDHVVKVMESEGLLID